MTFSARQIRTVLSQARALPLDSPTRTVEDFISDALGLNAAQRLDNFPGDGGPKDQLARVVGELASARDDILSVKCAVATFAVYEDELGIFQISGLQTYLERKDTEGKLPILRARLLEHVPVRNALRQLQKGQHLEAVAAAIMNASCRYGEATQASADQGIDAVGWNELLMIEAAFSTKLIRVTNILPGEKVFLLASSKAVSGTAKSNPPLLNPAHIRELVGGWIIQRSSAGVWSTVGIRMLSPVQMILVTTYRVSDGAKALCLELGIQIWGLPELVYLVCRWAPDSVFDSSNGYQFSSAEFRKWWKERDSKRIVATSLVVAASLPVS